ncbi:hypothetical protein [Spiroplasma endosymbiont of Sarcophaga variegata]|uniref:hypothetical protein n=1 Tax=Spiroplasma endosymbiont of Sarcophaga variegata TaxID=3066304 RepID=UPI003AF8B750
MENIKICESGWYDRSRNFAKDFDFIKEFSTNSETKEIYKPYKQKDKNKNISNYRIHKSSMQKYNNCGQKIISYIVKTPERWIIFLGSFVHKDKFKDDFLIVGIVPQFIYYTRTNREAAHGIPSIKKKGFNIFVDLIELEQYDHKTQIEANNQLTKIWNNNQEWINKRIENNERIKKLAEVQEKKLSNQPVTYRGA